MVLTCWWVAPNSVSSETNRNNRVVFLNGVHLGPRCVEFHCFLLCTLLDLESLWSMLPLPAEGRSLWAKWSRGGSITRLFKGKINGSCSSYLYILLIDEGTNIGVCNFAVIRDKPRLHKTQCQLIAISAPELFLKTSLPSCLALLLSSKCKCGAGRVKWGRTKRFSLDLLLQAVQQPLHNLAFPANLETLWGVSRVLTNAIISLSTKCQPWFFHSWLWAISIWGALISTPEPWEWWGPLWTMWWESLDWEEGTTLCYSHWLLGVL